MPRPMHPTLREMHERANPATYLHVEVSAPDAGSVLRRADDQLLLAPSPLVSLTPAGGLARTADGAVAIPATADMIVNLGTASGTAQDITPGPASLRVRGCVLTLTEGIEPMLLRTIRPTFIRIDTNQTSRMEVQVYRVTRIPGARVTQSTTKTTVQPWTEVVFTPLLSPALVLPRTGTGSAYDGAGTTATPLIDLTNYQLVLDPTPELVGGVRYQASYLFVITALDSPHSTYHQWPIDTASSRVIAGVGSWQRQWWGRNTDRDQWTETVFADAMFMQLTVDKYTPPLAAANVQAVYAITLPSVPTAASTGRIVFERSVPTGCAASLALSTAGTGGPWSAVTDGDIITTKQTSYHLRVTLTPSPSQRRTPVVRAVGLEFRVPYDVSAESVVSLPTTEADVPWCVGAIGEGALRVLRTGLRDYLDLPTRLSSAHGPSSLECDVWLASRHASAPRSTWLRLARLGVANRVPGATSETFTLRSYLSRTRRMIPPKVETVTTVHTVVSATSGQIVVNGATPLIGTPFTALGYYVRVRTSSGAPATFSGTPTTALRPGYTQTIDSSTGTNTLLFTATPLPGTLAAGDIIEVHSGRYAVAARSWVDADPAAVWREVLEDDLAVPPERLGLAGMVGGGLPPTVAERAPGDATLQAQLLVTRRIDEATDAAELIDALSFLMGGVTMELNGQIVFVRLFPQRKVDGTPTIPLLAPVLTVDGRDTLGEPETPPGLEHRAPSVSCTYGVNTAAVDPTVYPEHMTSVTDADAVAWLTNQDVEALGVSDVPPEIAVWCYNTADSGRTLATLAAMQVVRVASTGLRVFSWVLADAHYELLPGDHVTLLTDQYTDYDPARGESLAGWLAVRCVLISVGGDGRTCRALVAGLADVARAQGGGPGTQAGDRAPIAVPGDFSAVAERSGTASGYVAQVRCGFTRPSSPFFVRMEYDVRVRQTGTATYSATATVPGSATGPDRIVGTFGTDVEVTPVTVSAGGTRTTGTPVVVTMGANPQATLTDGAGGTLTSADVVRQATAIRVPIVFGESTMRVKWWSTSGAAVPSGASIEGAAGTTSGEILRGDPTQVAGELVVALASATHYGTVTLVAYDGLTIRGQAITVYAQGDGTNPAPSAPTAVASVGVTGTTMTVRVTMPNPLGSPTPQDVRAYAGAISVTVTRTAGAGATQDVVVTGLSPNTTYTPAAELLSAAGAPSTTVSGTPATTSTQALPTPTLVSAVRTSTSIVSLTWTAGVGTPAGVEYGIVLDGVDTDQRVTGTSSSQLVGPVAVDVQVFCTYPGSGWTDSAYSNTINV